MQASPTTAIDSPPDRVPLRLALHDTSVDRRIDGAWWPQSRDLQVETADLVDHFPEVAGHINRLLFSRPDWDDSASDGRGVRSIRARRGSVKVGSFPSDDTRLMILTMSTGRRISLRVVQADVDADEADRQLKDVAAEPSPRGGPAPEAMRWDEGHPSV